MFFRALIRDDKILFPYVFMIVLFSVSIRCQLEMLLHLTTQLLFSYDPEANQRYL